VITSTYNQIILYHNYLQFTIKLTILASKGL